MAKELRMRRWTCSKNGWGKNKYILFGNLEENTPLGRPRRRLEDDIRINLKEIWR